MLESLGHKTLISSDSREARVTNTKKERTEEEAEAVEVAVEEGVTAMGIEKTTMVVAEAATAARADVAVGWPMMPSSSPLCDATGLKC